MANEESRFEWLRSELANAIEKEDLDEEWLRQAVRHAVDWGIDAVHLLEMINYIANDANIDLQPMMLTISQVVEEEAVLYQLTNQMMQDAEQGLDLLIQQQAKKMALLVKAGKISEAAALDTLMGVFPDVDNLVDVKGIKKHLKRSIKNS